MILRHRDWDKQIKLEKTMTVGDFVEEIVLKDENKKNKYYTISIKESIDGKRNLIIYYQYNNVKSHHSTGAEFDYNTVIDLEIIPSYSERIIKVDDIISMDSDFEHKYKHKALTKEEIYKTTEELLKKWEQEEGEKDNRRKVFEDNVTKENLIICIRQFVSDLEKENLRNSELKHQIEICKKREENLQQQIKWLEYRLNDRV